MENYYEILGVKSTASQQEIKQNFRKLALIHHPDKMSSLIESQEFSTDPSSAFVDIFKAWNVLSNDKLRREYDAAWHQRCSALSYPVQDTVSFDELWRDETRGTYLYPCRCGDDYELTTQQLSFNVDYLCCPSCSLCIKIYYTAGS